jgi:uncharacterized protein YdhG (YjbR/CyaY superfamily)
MREVKTVDEYIEACPADVRGSLEQIRRTIRKAAPEAVETISYQMPTFKLGGKFLVSFAAWKKHIGFYPIPSGTEAFKKAISSYRGAKSTARFPVGEPIPYDLVRQMVTFRMKENQERKKK